MSMVLPSLTRLVFDLKISIKSKTLNIPVRCSALITKSEASEHKLSRLTARLKSLGHCAWLFSHEGKYCLGGTESKVVKKVEQVNPIVRDRFCQVKTETNEGKWVESSHSNGFFNSVTRLGEKSPFGRFFKGLGDFFFQKRSPKFWLHFGRFFEMVQNLDF